MDKEKQIHDGMRYAATLCDEAVPSSPVIMGGGDPAFWIECAHTFGYHALELNWPDPSQIPLAEISEACRRYGMNISAFATGRAYVKDGLSLIDPAGELRRKAISRLKAFVDAAAQHDATVILGCIRGNLSEEIHREEVLYRLAESTREVALYAENKGVGLVFEAINRYENNYLNTAVETIAFIKDYALPNTRLLLDTFHMNIEESDFKEAILASRNLLGYIHIADSNRLYPGAGHIPFKGIFDALNKIDYKGFISAECLPLPDSQKALAEWMKGVKQAIKETAEE
ncbi:sugar phosphate isomerase/epimerase [Bacillota bacterium]